MKLTTFFISRTKQIYPKTLKVSESEFNMTLGHFSNFCLRQQLFANKDFYTKTSLCNVFKTKNTKTLIKAISESHNKLLQMP